jgi:general stress protein CsbA
MKWPSWINVILGVWLFIAPWSLHYVVHSAVVNDMTLGVLVFIAGLWAATAASEMSVAAWVGVVLGAWLILAPWILGYHTTSTRAMGNDVIIGIVTVILSLVRAGTARAVVGNPPPPTSRLS